MNESYVDSLDSLGYFRGLTSAEDRALREEILKRGWPGIFNNFHRLYAADAEDLAEGGIGRFIAEVTPFLTAEGVHVPEIEEDASGDGYVVRVGGTDISIYDARDLELDEQQGLIWGLSMTRGFRIVNELLALAESTERVYAVNGGNDLFAFFLTQELYRSIVEHPEASPGDGPYVPTEEYPWFGQPH